MAGRDYNIHITWRGNGSKQAFGGGNLSKMNNGVQQKTKEITKSNLKGFASIGLAFRGAQMGSEVFGAYTNNRFQQRKNRVALTFAKYAVGIAINPALGSLYMASDLAYRGLMYNIDIENKNLQADYYKRLSGNNANSGSRYRGDYS